MDYYSPEYSFGQGELPPDLLAKTGANLRGMLSGELPPDVQNLLAQRAAELGISSGTSGSEFNKFRSLRDLGLTSLDRMDAATKMLAPEFISPAQSVAFQRNRPQGTGQPFYNKPPTSAPLLQPRTQPGSPTGGAGGVGRMNPISSDINSIIAELGQKYGPSGGFGMTPMGGGGVPSYGGSWNAGPLDTGQGTFFAGDPSQLSPEELFAYGLDQPVSNTVAEANPWDQAVFTPTDLPEDYG